MATRKTKKQLQEERNALVEANMGLAVHFAQHYQVSRMEFEDIVQEAYLGLIDAAELFDPERGTKFSTYAGWHILKRIMDAVHNRNEMVRTPRRRPSHICGSLDESASSIPDQRPSVEEQFDADERVNAIHDCIRELPAREAIVIRMRHGVNTERLTLAKVASILGVTPERVRQIQNSGEEKLRALVRRSAILNEQGAIAAEHPKESAAFQTENETDPHGY